MFFCSPDQIMLNRIVPKDYSFQFENAYYFEPLAKDPSYFTKKMFGCLAIYVHGKLMALISEDSEQKHYKNKKFNYLIWNGLLLPTEKQLHSSLIDEFSGLTPHPVLPKWLYLPWDHKNCEKAVTKIIRKISLNDSRFGVWPKLKKAKKIKPRNLK